MSFPLFLSTVPTVWLPVWSRVFGAMRICNDYDDAAYNVGNSDTSMYKHYEFILLEIAELWAPIKKKSSKFLSAKLMWQDIASVNRHRFSLWTVNKCLAIRTGHGNNWDCLLSHRESPMILVCYSAKFWLAVYYSTLLQADWLILENNERATLHINLPYWSEYVTVINELYCSTMDISVGIIGI